MRISARFAVRSAAILLALAALLWGARFVAGPHRSAASVLAAELKSHSSFPSPKSQAACR